MHSLLPRFLCQNGYLHYKNREQILMDNPKLLASLCRTWIKTVSIKEIPPVLECHSIGLHHLREPGNLFLYQCLIMTNMCNRVVVKINWILDFPVNGNVSVNIS